jgi:type II secretory pathway pseudopilin PulG
MVVVLILGILATIAVPLYQGYVYKAKANEAVGFLTEIGRRQEAYKSSPQGGGTYFNVSGLATNWYPNATPNDKKRTWPDDASWAAIGAQPPGRACYFSYVTVAGVPGTVPGQFGFTSDLGYDGSDFWYVSRALGDLDNDGTQVTFEAYSEKSAIWDSSSQGWE